MKEQQQIFTSTLPGSARWESSEPKLVYLAKFPPLFTGLVPQSSRCPKHQRQNPAWHCPDNLVTRQSQKIKKFPWIPSAKQRTCGAQVFPSPTRQLQTQVIAKLQSRVGGTFDVSLARMGLSQHFMLFQQSGVFTINSRACRKPVGTLFLLWSSSTSSLNQFRGGLGHMILILTSGANLWVGCWPVS